MSVIAYFRNRPLATLNVLFLFLIIEYIVLGKYSYIQIHDFGDYDFPRFIALWRNFAESGLQYWSSDIGTGIDRLSNVVYYDNLCSLLIAIFPAWLAYQFYIVLTTYAGIIGFYKLNTVYFDQPKELSALVAIFIPLIISSVNSFGLSAGIQFYPFTLYLIYWINSRVDNPVFKLILLTGLIYITSITIAFVLSFVFFGPFMMLWLIMIGRVKPSTTVAVAVAFLVVTGIHYANITAVLSHVLESHRSEFAESLISSHEARNYFFYLIVPVLVSAFLIVKNKIIDARLLAVFSAFLLITIGDSILNYLWSAMFGNSILATSKISRLGFFSTSLFGVIILWLASRIGHKERKILTLILLVNFIAVAIGLKWINAVYWIKQGNYVANFETKSLKDLRAGDNHSIFRVAVVHGVTHPNMLSAYGFESADGYSGMYPRHYKHYWTQVITPFLGREHFAENGFLDWGSRFYLFTDEAPGGGRYEVVNFREFFNLNLLSLANVKYVISHQPLIDNRLEMISSGVNAMRFGNLDKFKLRLKENFSGRESLFIYKNPEFLERVFAVNNVKYFSSEKDLLAYAGSASIDDIKSSAFVLDELKEKLSQYDFRHTKASITITGYTPGRIDFLVNSSGDVMAVLTNSFDPGWKCMNEGRSLDISNVDGSFFAVVLRKGKSAVSCRYQPQETVQIGGGSLAARWKDWSGGA